MLQIRRTCTRIRAASYYLPIEFKWKLEKRRWDREILKLYAFEFTIQSKPFLFFHLFTLSNQSMLCMWAVSLSYTICFGCLLNLHVITSDVSTINIITIEFVDYREILYEVDSFIYIEVIQSFSTPFLLKCKYILNICICLLHATKVFSFEHREWKNALKCQSIEYINLISCPCIALDL